MGSLTGSGDLTDFFLRSDDFSGFSLMGGSEMSSKSISLVGEVLEDSLDFLSMDLEAVVDDFFFSVDIGVGRDFEPRPTGSSGKVPGKATESLAASSG